MSDAEQLAAMDFMATTFLGIYFGTLVIQAIFTGIYTLLLCHTLQAAVPGLKRGQHKLVITVLLLLYFFATSNFAVAWAQSKTAFVDNNATRMDMFTALFGFSESASKFGVVSGLVAMVLADALLMWRCYVLWAKSKWILAVSTFVLLVEIAMIPVTIITKMRVGPNQMPIINIYFFISMAVTMITTGMIVYRVGAVSKGANTQSRYSYIMEILIESGATYSAILFITGIVQALQDDETFHYARAAAYLTSVTIPMTGIAPTLISLRIMTGNARSEASWSQPASSQPATKVSFRVDTRTLHDQSILEKDVDPTSSMQSIQVAQGAAAV